MKNVKHTTKSKVAQWLVLLFIIFFFVILAQVNMIIGLCGLLLEGLAILAHQSEDVYLLW